MNKIRFGSLFKIFGALAIVSSVSILGWNAYADSQVNSYKFIQIAPGSVSLIAVRPGAGYRILVANSIAQLEELSDQQFGKQDDVGSSDGDVVSKRKMPIRDLVGSMAGKEENLKNFIMSLNAMSVNDLPPVRVVWKSEDINKAIAGDKALKTKLENDLNMTLAGQPLERIDPEALENGIVIDYPVSLNVKVGEQVKRMTVRIQEGYRAGFVNRVVDRYKEKTVVTPEALTGFYLAEAADLRAGKAQPEDLTKTIPGRYSVAYTSHLIVAPEKVLKNTEVILNEDFLEAANTQEVLSTNGQRSFDVNLRLTKDGRLRLWKYSRANKGFQLLMIVDGIAVAAPRIGTELATFDVKVSQLTDKRLAMDAATRINQLKKKENKH